MRYGKEDAIAAIEGRLQRWTCTTNLTRVRYLRLPYSEVCLSSERP